MGLFYLFTKKKMVAPSTLGWVTITNPTRSTLNPRQNLRGIFVFQCTSP